MSQPAQAHAAGNPASAAAAGIAQRAISAALPSLNLPGLSQSASSSSGDIGNSFGFDSSGWQVNVNGASVGTGSNAGLWIAGAIVLGALLWRKKYT